MRIGRHRWLIALLIAAAVAIVAGIAAAVIAF